MTNRKGRFQYYFSAGNTCITQIQGNHTVSPLITEKAHFVMFSVDCFADLWITRADLVSHTTGTQRTACIEPS